ncbi:MAG: hypothetical protein EBS41_05335 [Actinobacteria bacterium]|nr:hypothetical protein [Actinomycetota bacterium]
MFAADEHIKRRRAQWHACQRESRSLGSGQILEAVDCSINAMFEQGSLQFSHKHAVTSNLSDWHVLTVVAPRGYRLD